MRNYKTKGTAEQMDKLMRDLGNVLSEPMSRAPSDEELIKYALGRVTPKEKATIEGHVAASSACAARLDRIIEASQPWQGEAGKQRLDVLSEKLLRQLKLHEAKTPLLKREPSEPLRKKVIGGEAQQLESPFQQFLHSQTPDASTELALAAETFDIDALRAYYNENLIPVDLVQIHVTIAADANEIILHFLGSVDLNGKTVEIYSRTPSGDTLDTTVTRTIKGNEVGFTLGELGLTVRQLDRVGFRLEVENQWIDGRL